MATNYRKGFLAELKALKELEAQGYVAARTTGSRSPFDVVAVGPQGVRLVQVKRTRSNPARSLQEARQEQEKVPRPPGVTREVWVWQARRGWVAKETL